MKILFDKSVRFRLIEDYGLRWAGQDGRFRPRLRIERRLFNLIQTLAKSTFFGYNKSRLIPLAAGILR